MILCTSLCLCLGSSSTDEVNDLADQDAVPSDMDDDDDVTMGKSKKKSSSPRKSGRTSATGSRKRGASSSPSVTAKKSKASPRGKKSITSAEESNMDVDNQAEPTTAAVSSTANTETPTKKPRTSGTRKTPTSTSSTPEASDEYVRKLRPRK